MTVTCSDGTRRASFVELQLHEKSILAHNNRSKAHDHYDYFRSLLEAKYDSELDMFLERTILVRACHRHLPHTTPAAASPPRGTRRCLHLACALTRPSRPPVWLQFLQEVAGNPVLLSMLVLLFGEAEGDAAATPSVPTNRYELYILVLSKVVRG